MTLNTWFAHLTKQIAPPFTWHWWPYCRQRAAEIAKDDPECAELPGMLEAEYQRLKSLTLSSTTSADAGSAVPPEPSSAPTALDTVVMP